MSYRIILRAETALLIDGQYSSLVVDKATARRKLSGAKAPADPYLPASAIKGAMRIEFERLLRSVGETICNSPDPRAMCPSDKPPCLACRLFGGPGIRQSKLRFYDAFPSGQTILERQYEERMGVSIDRQRRRAADKRLFSQQAAPEALTFHTTITSLTPLDAQEANWFAKALAWWQREGLWIGGNRSRGMGRLSLEWELLAERPPASPGFTPQGAHRLYKICFKPDSSKMEPFRIGPAKLRDYLLRSLDFVPGRTARGAAAAGWKRQGMSEPDISTLILRQSRFSHLYPGDDPCKMRPATAVWCKQEKDKHSLQDTLLKLYVLQLAEKAGRMPAMLQLLEELEACPVCAAAQQSGNQPMGGSLVPAARFVSQANRQLMIKLALNRMQRRAQEGLFYIYETLEGTQDYSGILWADEEVESLPERLPVLVGGARNKGFGLGTLIIDRHATIEIGDQQKIASRMDALNTTLANLLQTHQLTLPPNRLYFSLMLLTDLVLPPSQTLRAMLEAEGWQWEAATLHWTRQGGFNEQAGRPRPQVPMLERGGVILLSVSDVAQAKPTLLARLQELEQEGLGLLRRQGCGWIYACHEFHTAVA